MTFGGHEPFVGRLLFSKLHRDLSDSADDDHVCLLKNDGVHRPGVLLFQRHPKGAEEGGL
jgi:hypothetical protein